MEIKMLCTSPSFRNAIATDVLLVNYIEFPIGEFVAVIEVE